MVAGETDILIGVGGRFRSKIQRVGVESQRRQHVDNGLIALVLMPVLCGLQTPQPVVEFKRRIHHLVGFQRLLRRDASFQDIAVVGSIKSSKGQHKIGGFID